MAFQFAPPFPPVINVSMKSTLVNLGLSTNLQLVLDAGDGASVASGSQTKWLDVSGGGYDHFRGTDATSQASDPTYNGTVGGQSSSEFYSFDGGDYFTYDTTNEAWMESIHKDNAIFSFAAWVYPHLDGNSNLLLGTRGSSGTGFSTFIVNSTPTAALRFDVQNAGVSVQAFSTTETTNTDAWNFVAMSFNETTGTALVNINGTAGTYTGKTYSSPAAGAASQTLQIGAIGGGNTPIRSGSRLANMAIWQGTALSAANLAAIFTATRTKFGI